MRLFASYSPAEVVLRYADMQNPQPPQAAEQEDFDAAIGFVDVSGFTALSEKLNKDHGRKGAELLNQCARPAHRPEPKCPACVRRRGANLFGVGARVGAHGCGASDGGVRLLTTPCAAGVQVHQRLLQGAHRRHIPPRRRCDQVCRRCDAGAHAAQPERVTRPAPAFFIDVAAPQQPRIPRARTRPRLLLLCSRAHVLICTRCRDTSRSCQMDASHSSVALTPVARPVCACRWCGATGAARRRACHSSSSAPPAAASSSWPS